MSVHVIQISPRGVYSVSPVDQAPLTWEQVVNQNALILDTLAQGITNTTPCSVGSVGSLIKHGAGDVAAAATADDIKAAAAGKLLPYIGLVGNVDFGAWDLRLNHLQADSAVNIGSAGGFPAIQMGGTGIVAFGATFYVDNAGNLVANSLTSTTYLTLQGAAPAHSNSSGTQGQIAVDDSYLYVCTATNTWKRVALNLTSW